MKMMQIIAEAMACLLLKTICCPGQPGNRPVTPQEKDSIIKKALLLVQDNFVSTEKLPVIQARFRQRLDSNVYRDDTALFQFLERFNTDLKTIGSDKHLGIYYGPPIVRQAALSNNDSTNKKIDEKYLHFLQYENFGLREVKRLDGNIGYFRFIHFADPDLAKESMTAAMNFLAYSYAIIIDLRDNGGGSGELARYLMGYFLKDSLKLSELKWRKNNEVKATYIKRDSLVKKLQVPVYIIVSKKTASAAESVAFTLQLFKRAVIIGEQTQGKANPGNLFVIDSTLYMMIPMALPTRTWEGTGVIPDIKVNAGKALLVAQIEAMKNLASSTGDQELRQLYAWKLFELQSQLDPRQADSALFQHIPGHYSNGRNASLKDNSLFYEIEGFMPGTKLTYLMENTFGVEGRPGLRVRFPVNPDGNVQAVMEIWDDGVMKTYGRIGK